MDLNLSNKIALVSGSSSGIGKGIAEVMLREGCTVFLNGRDEDKLNNSLNELRDKTSIGNIYKICTDLTITQNINKALDLILKQSGRCPDIVIANIGSGRSVKGWDVDDDEWLRMFNLNFFASVRLCRESIRVMKESGGGNIVCISSIAGCEAIPAPIPYSAAKAAVLSFIKNTADIAAQYNIRINAVSPGNVLFEGGTWDRKLKENKDNVMEYINRSVPMRGFAFPEDIGNAVVFLASDKAKFITGANFVVDGGQARKFI